MSAATGLPLTFLDADAVRARMPYPALIAALEATFRAPPLTLPRQALPYHGAGDASPSVLLVMTALNPAGLAGVKVVTVNADRTDGAVRYIYIALDPKSGHPLALIDGEALSSRRTAAVSALAATKLARAGAADILVVGTGAVARELARAYRAAFPLARIAVWGRRREAAERLALAAAEEGIAVAVAPDLDAAVAGADIVTAATAATAPILRGDLLKPGAHVDLIGGFSRGMREADDAVMRRAAVIITDNEASVREAGDLVQPVEAGVIEAGRVATLTQLLTGASAGRGGASDITVFKSVGHAMADLAGAELLLRG